MIKNLVTFKFLSDHPLVQRKNFEERLALRLLDIACGRDNACTPEPVPFLDDQKTTRMIGGANNFWLTNKGDGVYTFFARYPNDALMNAVEAIIGQEYRHMLAPRPLPPVDYRKGPPVKAMDNATP